MFAGLEAGAGLGALFSVPTVVAALIGGGELRTRSGDPVSVLWVLFAFIVAGPVTGVLFGLAFPLMRRWVAAYLIGAGVSIPFVLSLLTAFQPLRPWTGAHTFFLLAMTLLLGGLGGLMVRDFGVQTPKRRKRGS